MIFTRAQVDRLVQGKTVQVRQLVKNDFGRHDCSSGVAGRIGSVLSIWSRGGNSVRTKWAVGRSYCVQLKGGALWYCPNPICKQIGLPKDIGWHPHGKEKLRYCNSLKDHSEGEEHIMPLRIVITSISRDKNEWVLTGVKKKVRV